MDLPTVLQLISTAAIVGGLLFAGVQWRAARLGPGAGTGPQRQVYERRWAIDPGYELPPWQAPPPG